MNENLVFVGSMLITFALSACHGLAEEESSKSEVRNDKAVVWVQGAAGKLCAYSIGSGSLLPVVFVHSLAGDWQQWLAQLHHLGESRQAIAFDMRGHGRSIQDADLDYSIEAMAEDLAAVAQHFELDKFVLIGHSFGGSVSALYAGKYPDRVAGLLFVDPAGDQRRAPEEHVKPFMQMLQSDSYPQAMQSYWNQILTNSNEDVKTKVISSMEVTQKEAVIGAFKSMLRFDIVSSLNNYPGPKVTIIGDLNNQSYSLHNVIPALPHKSMSGTGHWLQMDRPEEFNKLMDGFLEEHNL